MRLKVLYGAILVVASLAALIQALANPISLVFVSSQLTWVITIYATARTVDGYRAIFSDSNIAWHNSLKRIGLQSQPHIGSFAN
jgi:hypothetical protein